MHDEELRTIRGVVTFVETLQLGTELVGAHSSGVSALVVRSADELDDPSGSVTVDGDTLAYSSVDLAVSGDVDFDTLNLTAPTPHAYADGAVVARFPLKEHKVALVQLGSSEDVVSFPVKHNLWNKLADGPRADGAGEAVRVVQRSRYEWVVDDIYGKPTYTFDGPVIVTGSIKLASAAAILDATDMPIIDGADTGSLPTAFSSLGARVTALESGSYGGSANGTVIINCGNSSSTGGIVTIDCGGAA